ncbi:unnamed protein product [Cuscuta campestris]|uniref:Retrotransposon gag domain-containing protein n=1 Tax=Cuscuta campestris TaxID=132261 RepID=A0A484M2M4_9ASTE|nr:unnamed protein product [Cuscuta campestris]
MLVTVLNCRDLINRKLDKLSRNEHLVGVQLHGDEADREENDEHINPEVEDFEAAGGATQEDLFGGSSQQFQSFTPFAGTSHAYASSSNRDGSCTDTIQPLISNVSTARDAWLNLHSSFASASRGHILALKSKLGKNPRGNRSINDYLHDMHSISNELALNQSPVKEEDLVAHALNQLGPEYDPISSAVFLRGSALPFTELGDVLRDFKRKLQLIDDAAPSLVATAHTAQRHPSAGSRSYSGHSAGHSSQFSRSSPTSRQQHGSSKQPRRTDGSSCQFFSIPGHDIRVCRKLARLLRDNGLQSMPASSYGTTGPVAHATTASPNGLNHWMFDSGASHHTTPAPQSLQSFSDYGGPDEIRLGNGSENGGASSSR